MGTSLAVQCLRLCASTAGGIGSIPGWGTKIPHAAWHGQKIYILLKDTKKAETLLLTGCHGSAEMGQVKECLLKLC